MKLDRRKHGGFHVNVGQLVCIWVMSFIDNAEGIILSGAPNSYARYPKWAHSFENTLSLDIKTKQSNGLVLYTDDGGIQGNFYALTIADGRIQLDFRLGDNTNDQGKRPVNTIRIEEIRVDDDKWHKLNIFQSWENVKLELDDSMVFKILNQRSFVFGNLLKNSDVYIGGLPSDIHLLPSMSSPLRRHTRHLAANVRNLIYRLYPQGITAPQLLDAFGTRHNEDDFCKPTGFSSREAFVCKDEGRCYNTNDGPKCDCSASTFEGLHCDQEKLNAELSFFGQEWVGYDLSNTTSGPVRAKRENVSLAFKTVHGAALLFFAGDDANFLQLSLENGALYAYSKFEGTDKRMIRLFNPLSSGRYDDDMWHTVIVERSLHMMVLTVDQQRDEIRQYAPESDWIVNAFAYVGGLPKKKQFTGITRKQFRGCMRKVRYEADAQEILFVNLADQGFGDSVIRTGGELAFSCNNPQVPPDILSFNTNPSFLTIPKWNSMASGSIAFHFRTSEPDGLILFHGYTSPNSADYLAFELIDGHLYMVINLGSGYVRLQTTARKITDETTWHSVSLERVGRSGSVIVDTMKTDFNTPGVSANLIVDEPIYLGGVDFNNTHIRKYPPSIWSITLRKGFIGCLKNVRVNGISAKIASLFEQQNATGISVGCSADPTVDHCDPNPCQNFGRCESGYNAFHCDCSTTNMDGPTCALEPQPVELEGSHPISVVLPSVITSEAESIEIRFKTEFARGVLLDTKAVSNRTNRFVVALVGGELELHINFGHGKHTFNWGNGLHDNRWHVLRVKRRGEKLLLFIDGKWEHSYYLPSHELVLELDELSVGQSLHHSIEKATVEEPFKGQMSKLTFNDIDLLDRLRRDGKLDVTSAKDGKGQRNVKTKSHSISFTNITSYVTLAPVRIAKLRGDYRISFKFQTLARNCLLFASATSDLSSDAVILEVVNGRVRYTYQSGVREETVMSPYLSARHHLSDMRWHTLLVYQDGKTGEHVLLVDNTTTVMNRLRHHKAFLTGTAYFGGVPPSSPVSGRLAVIRGFRGCMSAMKLGDETLDLIEEAEKKHGVIKGCPGPIAKCSPGACSNGGRCIQQWNSIRCDCSLTAHAGSRCHEAATTYEFGIEPAAICYEYTEGERPSTEKDFAVLKFKTQDPEGVLLSVECIADRDYMTVFLKSGLLMLKFNLGSRDHTVHLSTIPLNDDSVHVVKIYRSDTNITSVIDKLPPVRYRPQAGNRELVTLNMQWRVCIGSALSPRHNNEENRIRRRRRLVKMYDSFQGEIGGVNYNGLHILDLLANGHPNVKSIGPTRQTALSPPVINTGEDVMNDAHYIEGGSSALIESIGPGCLSLEEQDTCVIDNEQTQGFFTAQLPTALTAPRRATPPPKPSNSGEYRRTTSTSTSTRTVTSTISTTTTTTTSTTTTSTPDLSSTTEMVPVPNQRVFDLNDVLPDEGSGLPDTVDDSSLGTGELPEVLPPLQNTPATAPAPRTTTALPPPTTVVTVLPRPYGSVREALEKNPDYAGSIWSHAQEVPEIDPTGVAWLRNRNRTLVTQGRARQLPTRPPPPQPPPPPPMPPVRKSTTTTTATTTTRPTRPPPIIDTTLRSFTTTTVPQKTKARTTNAFTVYPVRPTTPMGVLITSTMKPVEDFPRTALISVASVSVIMVIAVVVFCVFRCRQQPPPGDHYPMVSNGKTQNGYAPISSSEMSPQMTHDPATQPLISPRAAQVNGYQPLKGSVIPNGNGAGNGHAHYGNGNENTVGMNGGGGTIRPNSNGNAAIKKKEFKEWYV